MIQFDPTISMDTVISVVATAVTIVASVVGGIYALSSNTKKYELAEAYKSELLGWYEKTVGILCHIIHLQQNGLWEENQDRKIELLSNLPAQIEIGRFYFPNAWEKNGFGTHKHTAYQGLRQIVLDHLMDFYRIASGGTGDVDSLRLLERKFTSYVFDILDPRTRNSEYLKYTGIRHLEAKSREDFQEENPDYLRKK